MRRLSIRVGKHTWSHLFRLYNELRMHKVQKRTRQCQNNPGKGLHNILVDKDTLGGRLEYIQHSFRKGTCHMVLKGKINRHL